MRASSWPASGPSWLTPRSRSRHERHHLTHLRDVLHRARRALAAELVSQYEEPPPSLVTVIVSSSGFQDLLDSVQYLSAVKQQEQSIITATRAARGHARAAATRLSALQRSDAVAAGDAQTQAQALAGMDALLNSRQIALADARAAQSAALGATRERGAHLQAAIATIQKQVKAADQAEHSINAGGPSETSPTGPSETSPTGPSETSASGGGGLGGSGLAAGSGWSIPYPIVLCESGGQNLPPNAAGASGYYQIIPNTWHDFGGSGPAAYLAPKPEQDAVAARIWNNGAGASDWACSALVGGT